MALPKNIKLLTWFNFFTDFKLYAPIAIIYFAKVSGSLALGMSVFAVTFVSSAIFELPTGIFSDFLGRRKTIILGALTAVIYAIFYAAASSYFFLLIGAFFEGLSRAFYSGNNDAFLHDTLSGKGMQHLYSEYFGKLSSMFEIALAVSAIAGSVIAGFSFPLVMWLSVVPQIICLLISFNLLDIKTVSRESSNIYVHLKEALVLYKTNKKLRLLTIGTVINFALGETAYQFQAAFYQTLWPVWAIGIAKTCSNLGAFISFRISHKFTKKFAEIKGLLIGNFYSRIINIFAALFPTIISPILMSTTSLFYGIVQVAKSSLFQKEFSEEKRATMGSLNSFAGSLLFGVTSIFLGFLADKISPAKAIILFQIISFIPLWFYWKIFKHHS